MDDLLILIAVCAVLGSPIFIALVWAHLRAVRRGLDRRLKSVEVQLSALAKRAEKPSASTEVLESEFAPAHQTKLDDSAGTPEAVEPVQTPTPTATLDAEPAPDNSVHADPDPPQVDEAQPSSPVDWERWLGVRGAALGGGVVLAVAGLFFVQHAVQQGWFGPQARIISAAIFGALLLCSRGRVARVGHALLADVLVGVGAVLEYGAAWAAWRLFELVPMGVAFPWMLATTSGTCILALRHNSATIAKFGLVGGFATPVLLGTDPDGLGLFGYLLVLDLALIVVARKGRWKDLGPLALVGTTLLQALWLFEHATVETAGLGLLYLATFAVLFMFRPGLGDRTLDSFSRLAALGIAALLASVLALRTDLGVSLTALGPFLGVLTLGACAVSLLKGGREIVFIAGLADAVLGAAWLMRNRGQEGPAELWAWTVMMLSFAVVLALYSRFLDRCEETATGRPTELPFWLVTLGILPTLMWACTLGDVLPLGPVTLSAVVLFVLVGFVLAQQVVSTALPILAAGVGTLLALRALAAREFDPLVEAQHMPHVLGLAIVLLTLAWIHRGSVRHSPLAAAALLVPVILTLAPMPGGFLGYPQALLALTVLGTTACTWHGRAWSHGIFVAVVVIAEQRWLGLALDPGEVGSEARALAWAAGLMAVVTLGPLCAGRRIWRERAGVGRAALLAPVVWLREDLWRLRELALPEFGPATIPLALAAVSLTALAVILLQHRLHPNDSNLERVRAFSAAVAAGLLSLGVARWVGPVWGTVTLALAGLSWTALGVRASHERLRLLGLVVLGSAGAAVLVTTLIPYSLIRTDPWLFNRINYGFFVPLVSIAGGLALFMRAPETEQTRVAKGTLGPLLVLGVFAWLNVLIIQATTDGDYVLFVRHRITSRDLSMSLGWTAYSLVLLGLGTVGRISGLRWMSLGITLLTVGKVFLYDLGHLQGLYRVGSLAGLAACLLLVSFLYQRFVFRKTDSEPSQESE